MRTPGIPIPIRGAAWEWAMQAPQTHDSCDMCEAAPYGSSK